MSEAVRGVRLANSVSGVWMVLAGLLLPYPGDGAMNAVISGLTIVLAAIQGGGVRHRYGGGWRSLVASPGDATA